MRTLQTQTGAQVTVRSGLLEKLFRLSQYGVSVQGEVVAGLTTFFVMAYIVFANPAILNLGGSGLPIRAVATGTCLVAGLMTLAMGLYANRAIAIAPGMGINAIVAFTLVSQMGLTFPEAMGVVVVEGIIISLLVLLGLREAIMNAVPLPLKQGISVGIGFFILYIGLSNAGLISFASGLPALTPLNTWPILVTFVGLGAMLVLRALGFKAAILLGIVIAAIVAAFVPGNLTHWPNEWVSAGDYSLLGEFSFGFFDNLGVLTAILVVFSLMLTDFFDTIGTLIGVGSRAGYLDEKGNLPDAQKPLLVDSIAAVAGGAASVSSATSYIESAAGVEAGGRTGLSSVVTGILFLLAIPFVTLVEVVPGAAVYPALIFVGCLMVGSLKNLGKDFDWDDIQYSVPMVLTMLVMPLTYNIANGIGAGFISWVLIKVAKGKAREVHPLLYVVAVAFTLYFLRWVLFDATF